MATKKNTPRRQASSDGDRKTRDRAILISSAVILGLLFLLGLVAPALISMKSDLAALGGFGLLAACLTGLALLTDRLVLRFWR